MNDDTSRILRSNNGITVITKNQRARTFDVCIRSSLRNSPGNSVIGKSISTTIRANFETVCDSETSNITRDSGFKASRKNAPNVNIIKNTSEIRSR